MTKGRLHQQRQRFPLLHHDQCRVGNHRIRTTTVSIRYGILAANTNRMVFFSCLSTIDWIDDDPRDEPNHTNHDVWYTLGLLYMFGFDDDVVDQTTTTCGRRPIQNKRHQQSTATVIITITICFIHVHITVTKPRKKIDVRSSLMFDHPR